MRMGSPHRAASQAPKRAAKASAVGPANRVARNPPEPDGVAIDEAVVDDVAGGPMPIPDAALIGLLPTPSVESYPDAIGPVPRPPASTSGFLPGVVAHLFSSPRISSPRSRR